jgi:sigma-B regulation protein RsbQ
MKSILLIIAVSLSIIACERLSNRQEEFSLYDSTQYERVSINYEIQGSQDTCLVFIHGWNLNLRYWDAQVKYFNNRYRILTLDLAGHGNSARDRINWTAESFARDITTILEKENITKIILVGHSSLGGDVALEVAESVPDRVIEIVGIDCFRDLDFEMTPEYLDEFKSHYSSFKRNYANMADEIARQSIRTKDREVISRIVNDYKNADPKIALAIYKNVIPKTALEKYKLQKLNVPLVLVGGDYAPYDTLALNRYATKGYRLYLLEGAGKFPMIEEPDSLNTYLDKAFQNSIL